MAAARREGELPEDVKRQLVRALGRSCTGGQLDPGFAAEIAAALSNYRRFRRSYSRFQCIDAALRAAVKSGRRFRAQLQASARALEPERDSTLKDRYQRALPLILALSEQVETFLATVPIPDDPALTQRRAGVVVIRQPQQWSRWVIRHAVFDACVAAGVSVTRGGRTGPAARVLAVVLNEADRVDNRRRLSARGGVSENATDVRPFNQATWREWFEDWESSRTARGRRARRLSALVM